MKKIILKNDDFCEENVMRRYGRMTGNGANLDLGGQGRLL